MGVKIINEPKLYCEKSNGDFSCLGGEGDYIKAVMLDGTTYEGRIESIGCRTVTIEDNDYNFIEFGITDVDSIEES